jgi:formylglycine-generating enzyme required for sulfatase activity
LAPAPASSAGPAEGKYRVARGGSFGHFPRACRSAARASFNPAYQLDQLGLSVAMDIDPNAPRR